MHPLRVRGVVVRRIRSCVSALPTTAVGCRSRGGRAPRSPRVHRSASGTGDAPRSQRGQSLAGAAPRRRGEDTNSLLHKVSRPQQLCGGPLEHKGVQGRSACGTGGAYRSQRGPSCSAASLGRPRVGCLGRGRAGFLFEIFLGGPCNSNMNLLYCYVNQCDVNSSIMVCWPPVVTGQAC